MTFSRNLKINLVHNIEGSKSRNISILTGLVLSSAIIKKDKEKNHYLEIRTENLPLARFIKNDISYRLVDTKMLSISSRRTEKKRALYTIKIYDAKQVLDKLDIGADFEKLSIKKKIPSFIYKKFKYKKDFIAGVFLVQGSVSNPEKNYHLEMLLNSIDLRDEILELIESLGVKFSTLVRGKNHIIYIKDSQKIADFIGLIGALDERFKIEDAIIVKEIRNKVNRLVNCDTANLIRTADASAMQIEYIKIIDRNIGIENLDAILKETAIKRLEYPELSIGELAKCFKEKISKSGVNHRLTKLKKIALEFQNETKA